MSNPFFEMKENLRKRYISWTQRLPTIYSKTNNRNVGWSNEYQIYN